MASRTSAGWHTRQLEVTIGSLETDFRALAVDIREGVQAVSRDIYRRILGGRDESKALFRRARQRDGSALNIDNHACCFKENAIKATVQRTPREANQVADALANGETRI